MRRLTVIAAICAAVLFAACGSDSKTSSSSATTAAAAGAGSSSGGGGGATATTVKASNQFADVCSGRAAAVPPTQGQTIDYNKAASDLQFALDHAPSDIKPDLTTLATPLVQYFKLIAAANGNFVAAAQNPQFQQLAQRLSQADFQAAVQRVTAWFASHCS